VADQTSASVGIAAKPREVMAVIADFERYPEWIDSMKSAEVAVSGTRSRDACSRASRRG
jgi:Polyketide cyclase / dehydrase and lipid transport